VAAARPDDFMTDDATYAKLLERLAPANQQHVLRYWDALSAAQRQRLAQQTEALDLDLIARLYAQRDAVEDYHALAARAEGPPAFRVGVEDAAISRSAARQHGAEAIAAGKVGAVLVAGGQGSRLGFEHPKGMFPIGPVSGHSLFQMLLEKLAATRQRYAAAIPLYVMTSDATHDETVAYLTEHAFFGLPAEEVHFFQQGNLPAVDAETGALLLEARDSLALSPDGHGGMLAAMARSGALDDVRRRRLEQLFYFQVDNPLIKMCDPLFIGYHRASGSEMSTQVVAKAAAEDRVGNVVSIDGQVRIIEYSDLPAESASQRNADGSLRLWAGSIAVHVFDTAFLFRMAADPEGTPYHIARKAVPCLDADENRVRPGGNEKNAIKFERFIFDLLPAARRSIVMEVDAAQAFAPVKNADGAAKDSPQSVKRQMVALYRRWLTAAGAEVADGVDVEIRPGFALDAKEVAARLQLPCHLKTATLFE
jgi:UDP-N-acetylglucosamine/UDP-N-acetylgalactosamine diphosphorylase